MMARENSPITGKGKTTLPFPRLEVASVIMLRRVLQTVLLFACSAPFLWYPHLPRPLLWGFALGLWYLWFQLFPYPGKKGTGLRLNAMMGGRELLLTAGLCALAHLIVLPAVLSRGGLPENWPLTVLLPLLLAQGITVYNGFMRIVLTSARLRFALRILLLLLWWCPVLNLCLLWRACSAVRHEYFFALGRRELQEIRKDKEICKTRYPVVLVHGIFFRDWQLVNYWGRIPAELMRNGAEIYYGGQQSAAPVAVSAVELKERILTILRETGAEKVNLIAHSKGGLDCRYAITHLGLAPCVASLTTINTPHRGVVFAQTLLDRLPSSWVQAIAQRYNRIFRQLGDTQPDFLGGVEDLTARRCARFNQETPDMPGVLYQSVMSTMSSWHAAPFPLWLTYLLCRRYDQEANDGLVAQSSATWGAHLDTLTPRRRGRGISHGDVIDLMREDIPGFDVREFYVELLRRLKERGL